MTPLTALWLPIVLSAVVVFIASSLIHMLLGYHNSDWARLPEEDKFRDALRGVSMPPGDYMTPRCDKPADMKTPEYQEKMKQGPVMVFTVLPNGQMGMGKALVLWFIYTLIVSIFAGYIAGRALEPGVDYLEVFRFAGATAFAGYALGQLQNSIWYARKWSTTIKNVIDGLIYGLLTAGVFGWLWP